MIVGQKKIIEFSFNQNQVIEFANITGDNNPIHLNDKYARNLFFKKKIIHGYLSASIFSRVLGTIFPGEGTIYLKQTLLFKKPMFTDVKYYAKLTVIKVDKKKHIAEIITDVFDSKSDKKTISGKAKILNKKEII